MLHSRPGLVRRDLNRTDALFASFFLLSLSLSQRPEMDVRDKLGNMVISSSSSFGSSGRKKSKVKEGEVKRQVQRLIKK